MATTPPQWPMKALRILVPVTGLLLLIQYFAGLWTNAYAPANGFTSNTDYPALDLHYNVGFALGILAIILVIVAVFSRMMPIIGLAVVVLAGVLVAGFAGMDFVGTSPNPPGATIVMGGAFLVAFWGSLMLAMFVMMARRRAWMAPPSVPTVTA